MKHFIALITGLVLLAACGSPETDRASRPDAPAASSPDADASPAPSGRADEIIVKPEMDPLDRTGDTCGMAAFREYVGGPASEIPRDELPDTVRIVSPSNRVTMDYSPRRLNILTNEAGTIIALKCG